MTAILVSTIVRGRMIHRPIIVDDEETDRINSALIRLLQEYLRPKPIEFEILTESKEGDNSHASARTEN